MVNTRFSTNEDETSKLLVTKPKDLYLRAIMYEELGDFASALQALNEALCLDSRLTEAWLTKGTLLYQAKKYDEAIQCFQTVLAYDPKNVPTLFLYSLVMQQLGDNEKARHLLEQALHIRPADTNLLYNYSLLLIDENEEKSMKLLEQVLEIEPDHVYALYNLGTLYYKHNRKTSALHLLKKAITLPECPPEAWYNLGAIAYNQNARIGIKYFKEYLQRDPNSPEKETLLELIKLFDKKHPSSDENSHIDFALKM